MPRPNLNNLAEEAERKYRRREKRKKRNMKISGSSVKTLQKIIKERK